MRTLRIAIGFEEKVVKRATGLVDMSEYKRRQESR